MEGEAMIMFRGAVVHDGSTTHTHYVHAGVNIVIKTQVSK
mgnify:CR=1 FL=1